MYTDAMFNHLCTWCGDSGCPLRFLFPPLKIEDYETATCTSKASSVTPSDHLRSSLLAISSLDFDRFPLDYHLFHERSLVFRSVFFFANARIIRVGG
jgi:hypothetical protein